MNKKLIAAAIAAAVAAPAAMADVTVYGIAHLQLDSLDLDNGTENWQLNDRGSRLGFKGSEDLGDGLKAIFKYEMVYRPDGAPTATSNPAIAAARNSYVGLSGDFGTVLAGSHDTPAKVALYATGAELLGDSIMELTGSMTSLSNMEETRSGSAIAYISPNFSGVTAAVAIVPGENNTLDGPAEHWSAMLAYKGNGIKAAFGYEDLDTVWQLWNIGATYTMDNFTVGALYQNQERDNNVNAVDESTIWAVTGKASFGNNAVIATYTDTESDLAGGGTAEGDGFGIAVEHNFSKRTKAYAAYTNKDVDGAATTVTSVGNNVFTGGDQFSLGMIHKF